MNVGLPNAHDYIDPAYPGPWCSDATETGSTEHQAEFLADSVTSPDAVLNYPATTVRFLYGGLDNSSPLIKAKITVSILGLRATGLAFLMHRIHLLRFYQGLSRLPLISAFNALPEMTLTSVT